MDSIGNNAPPKVAFDVGTARTLGNYELLFPLGVGGMATVWTARRKGSRGFQKIVAVKVLHDTLQENGTHERMFLDEARIAARIKHPNVVDIYDLGDQGKLPVPVAVQIGIQVAAGLHAAHQAKDEDGRPLRLVHRDVSPQNILIGFDGTVKIVDFGVAKAASNTELTASGQIKGKIAYMSPEQVSGYAVDRRTDIFVLGVVLYLMTTGCHPFRGETDVETVRRLLYGPPPLAPEEIDPCYPEALTNVLCQALNRDPFDRYASMADLMHALETALPPGLRLSAEDLGAFMRSRLGDVRAQRRDAIRRELADHGEMLSSRSSVPSLPPPSPRPQDRASAPGGPPSSETMVVSTTSREPSRSRRRLGPVILLAALAGALGWSLGFVGARRSSASPASQNVFVPSVGPVCHPQCR
jgi:eukaryotic-like serine/threonine-protein kinase